MRNKSSFCPDVSDFNTLFFPSFSQLTDLRRAFIFTLKGFLTSRWNAEVEESWVLLFDFMACIMITGYSHKY